MTRKMHRDQFTTKVVSSRQDQERRSVSGSLLVKGLLLSINLLALGNFCFSESFSDLWNRYSPREKRVYVAGALAGYSTAVDLGDTASKQNGDKGTPDFLRGRTAVVRYLSGLIDFESDTNGQEVISYIISKLNATYRDPSNSEKDISLALLRALANLHDFMRSGGTPTISESQ